MPARSLRVGGSSELRFVDVARQSGSRLRGEELLARRLEGEKRRRRRHLPKRKRAGMRNQVVTSEVAVPCRLGRKRGDANRTNRTERNERNGANRSAGGKVAKGIYEKQPVGLCDTYVRSCPLAVTSPILYQMGSRAGRRRESLESIAEARIDNVSFETEISNRKRYEQ
jgi:hypothetical protein